MPAAHRPRLRSHVVLRPTNAREEELDRAEGLATGFAVVDPIYDRRCPFDPSARAVLERIDGERTVPALARAAGVSRDDVEAILRRLTLLLCLEGAGDAWVERYRRVRGGEEALPVHVLEEARFECQGAGDCCRSFAYGPLTDEDVGRLDRLDLARAFPRLRHEPFLEERPLPPFPGTPPPRPGEPAPKPRMGRYLRPIDGRCVFLLPDNRCGIHAHFGVEQKPNLCRIFPYTYWATMGGLKVWDNGECSRFSTSARKGLPVVQDLPRIEALLPKDLDLLHPPIQVAPALYADLAPLLAWQERAVRLVGDIPGPPVLALVCALRLEEALLDALADCPLEPGEPEGLTERVLSADPRTLLTPPPADPRPSLHALADAAQALARPVTTSAGMTVLQEDGTLSVSQYRELAHVLLGLAAVARHMADPASPLPPAFDRARRLPLGDAEVDAAWRISLRQQLFGLRVLVGASPRAGALRLCMHFATTAFGARLFASERGAPRAEALDWDRAHKLASRIFRNRGVTPAFQAVEGRAALVREGVVYVG